MRFTKHVSAEIWMLMVIVGAAKHLRGPSGRGAARALFAPATARSLADIELILSRSLALNAPEVMPLLHLRHRRLGA